MQRDLTEIKALASEMTEKAKGASGSR